MSAPFLSICVLPLVDLEVFGSQIYLQKKKLLVGVYMLYVTQSKLKVKCLAKEGNSQVSPTSNLPPLPKL